MEIATELEWRDLFRVHARAVRPLAAVGAAMAVLALGLGLAWSSRALLLGGVLAAAGMALFPLQLVYLARRQVRTNPALRGPMTYVLDDAGIAARTSVARGSSTWEGVQRAVETEHAFLVYFGARQVYILPQRALGDAQRGELRALLAAKLGDRARLAG